MQVYLSFFLNQRRQDNCHGSNDFMYREFMFILFYIVINYSHPIEFFFIEQLVLIAIILL